MANVRLQARWVVCDAGYGDAPAFLQRLAGTGLWYLAQVPRDTKVWPLLETDGQTPRALPSSWVPPQTRSRKGPVPHRERLHPASPVKVPLEELARQWPAAAGPRYRLVEGHKGPRVAEFLMLGAVLPLDRLPGPEVWVVIRRKVSGSTEEPEWKFYLSNAPMETSLSTFVRVSGMRWRIETCIALVQGRTGHGPLRAALLARLVPSHDAGHAGPSLPGSVAAPPEAESGGSCAPRPRVPCPRLVSCPAWTRTPPSRSASLRCACSYGSPCPSRCWMCLRHWR
jgi:DDE superfamily endonuclease